MFVAKVQVRLKRDENPFGNENKEGRGWGGGWAFGHLRPVSAICSFIQNSGDSDNFNRLYSDFQFSNYYEHRNHRS